jgi:hypothetical protein
MVLGSKKKKAVLRSSVESNATFPISLSIYKWNRSAQKILSTSAPSASKGSHEHKFFDPRFKDDSIKYSICLMLVIFNILLNK